MYEAEPMQYAFPKVTLLSATNDPLGALSAACAMYKGRVIRDLRDLSRSDRIEFWSQVQQTHLKAPLEFIDLHFMIEGVTRAITHQMVRQRTAVYAQESLRFAVKEEIAARPGPLISDDDAATTIWVEAVTKVWEAYKSLIANGIPAEEARGLLPHDTTTRLNYKTNLRNLADHLGNRLCTQAQFEWRMVGAGIRQAIWDYKPFPHPEGPNSIDGWGDPWQFRMIAESAIFRPVCFSMGHCPFHADFDRGCTIRERMDTGRQNEVRDEEWAADPKAAWQ
jgi:flavin-dependent thymidylate synthase